MTDDRRSPHVQRRSFLSRIAAGLAGSGAVLGFLPQSAQAAPQEPAGPWRGARHPQDDWYDQVPGIHRMFFDASSPNGAGEAITFANNYYTANRSGYSLNPTDLAVVVCLRHQATPFAYNDAIWQKYGAVLADRIKFMDPKTNAAPIINVYEARDYGQALPNRGGTISALAQRGVHFAVCDMATRAFSGLIAQRMSTNADDVYRELVASAPPNSHFVAAGILALNRSQEHGYAVAHMG